MSFLILDTKSRVRLGLNMELDLRLRICVNRKLTNIVIKFGKMPTSGTVGPNRSVTNILVDQEEELKPAASRAEEAPHASAIRLKNAKAPPHSVAASGREQKRGGDDDAGGCDGSGA
jgi:hypothetical protein